MATAAGDGVAVAHEPAELVRDSLAADVVANRPALLMYARSLAHSEHEADDLVQDTLERALRAAHRFQPGSNLRAWLMRIMRNLFLDRRRHHASVREVPIQSEAIVDDGHGTYRVGPLDFVSEEDVLSALGELKGYLRQAFVLYYHDGLSYDGIAARLNILKSTVGTRLCRARIRLRGILEPRIAPAGAATVISSRRRVDGWGASA
jgi:RNA polymerase sigma-70 factor (ECF subfamily)